LKSFFHGPSLLKPILIPDPSFSFVKELNQGETGLKAWPLLGISMMQIILLLAHWFIFHTWIVFSGASNPTAIQSLRTALFLLAFSFIASVLLSFRFSNLLVRAIYNFAAVWLGFLNFFFVAACLCWLAVIPLSFFTRVSTSPHIRALIAVVLFALAVLAAICGLFNAQWIRIRRVPIHLPNLPASWRGRTALLISDLHLGNVIGTGFCRRVVNLTTRLNPDIIFIPGDIFDGAKIDPAKLAVPLRELSPPLGTYFATGNHDEYGDLPRYLEVLTAAGIRVLNNESVTVDGLHILGVAYRESTHILHMRATLERLRPQPGQPSILLNHVPNRLPIVEQAGITLQLSGHTHGGQLFPFTWFTRRAFGKFTYGLQRFGPLQVYTSCGAGTWGPPMRVGTRPEVVLLQFK
jgi:predicted MPP superfamily phosphohydrolase